tara:strand:+ start:1272 stop:1574 length:303 start_codon:yes stop_codon:yes gene_type:complete
MWVITTSIVIVFLVFVIFSSVYKLSTEEPNVKWPPHVSNCPSYWIEDNKMCVPNLINTGVANPPSTVHSYDPTIDSGDHSYQSCKKIATDHKIFWDGIRN